ncbi:sulfide:quinone oxidoreductase [Lutimaribacter pacificus]|uniref:Sulfide:quinone oxidoreductase n=1 Tax=Lutimaribacter pacificus TaxID=391948 RepID=A0A1H0I2P3_9RHOB|nr:FAD/NAD(P)-binding oxidoreductase [Lutimaribacter pacificus]SDO25420.1 sulfide:quinone oxidoreductase [Lutimaribacter pacificus]SHK27932.1 sulfide:quinone oxidoreductase [Lutimaribacter pacificus]
MTSDKFLPSRRGFLGLAGGAALLAANVGPARAQKVATRAKIVILGAGAAGTALANRLVERLEGAEITIVDGRAQHWYQPGFTLIAAGLKPADYSVSQTAEWLPAGVTLVAEYAAEIDPEARTVTTAGGTKLQYDYLVTAPGLSLDWDAVEGFDLGMVGRDGIGAVYAGPDYAAKTWAEMDRFTSEGGKAVFFRPATEMKCAGAPLKYTFLTEDYASRKGNRDKVEIEYWNPSGALFGVPIVAEKVRMLFGDRGIGTQMRMVLKRMDPGRKVLTFEDADGIEHETDYDFTNVIPPQRAPEVIRQSGLSWADKWVDQGWVEVDQYTLRHNRYPNVFACGDVAGVPKGKTAASAKWQVPVVEDHLVAQIAGDTTDTTYNGYTSCPLITRVGRAMLIEFDYNNLTPSFPGVIAPLEELWISWLMKEVALKATYNAMLRGKA